MAAVAETMKGAIPLYYNDSIEQHFACIARIEEL